MPQILATLVHFVLQKKFVWVALDFIGLACQGKDIVFRFIIEHSSLRDFGPYVIRLFLYEVFFKMICGLC
jgi:hypothetical protein